MFFYFKDQKFLYFLGEVTKFLAQNKELRRSLEHLFRVRLLFLLRKLPIFFLVCPLHVNLNFYPFKSQLTP